MEETETKTSGIEVEPGKKPFNRDAQMLWKRRYETSCEFYKKGDHKERTENVIKYLHNDFSFVKGPSAGPFLNQFFIGLKTLIPMVVAHNPFVAVTAENDVVFEYDQNGMPIEGPDGQVVRHDISKTSQTIQGLLKSRLTKKVDFRGEIRKYLRDAITFNRGVFLIGHTVNTEYSGAFNDPAFHAYIKSVPPYRIKRQAGTKRIDEGTYFFHEYELPVSHMKRMKYPAELLAKCRQQILEEIKIDGLEEYKEDDAAGYYDDVKYIKLRTAYDVLTGEQFVFGDGCEEPLRIIKPDYSFKNPSVEFVPNELFQPEQAEPISDLMMGEKIVKEAQAIVDKAVKHVKEFNTGYDIEASALLNKNQKSRITKGIDRSFRVWADQALSGGKIRQREDLALGAEPINMVEYLFGYWQKMIAVYDFQQGGRPQDEETATKTQAKLQTSQFKGGDMSEMFTDSVNKALDKYLEVLIKTTDTKEVVECIGDAGEVEYRPFIKKESERGQYHCSLDLQSMGKVNDDVKVQQALKLYEIVKSDPDPQVQQRVNKVALFERIVKGLGLGNEGILRKIPDTQGMDEQQFREYLKQQMIKARMVADQIEAGAKPLPPTPDDDDDIHLTEYLGRAQKLRQQAATNPDPVFQQQTQMKVDGFLAQAQFYIQRKQERESIEARMGGVQPSPTSAQPQGMPPPQGQRVPVANNPPIPGQMLGQAQRTGVLQ